MKQLLMLAGIALLAACNSGKDSKTELTLSSNEPGSVTYPVTSEYSATWEIGDPKHAAAILSMYKGWDEGNLDALKATFADSIELNWASGDIMKGTRDNVFNEVKAYRDQYAAIKNTVHGFLSLRHKDTKEEWVCVWTKEVSTTKAGKTDSIELQENWRIDRSGKTNLAFQYERKPSKQ